MPDDPIPRKLTVILAADVAGYSRLTGLDEEGTHRRLKDYRVIIDALIAEHRGRIFSGSGDAVIAEYSSPVEAVRCALAIQAMLAEQNKDVSQDQRMLFRIGINLGDVMIDGDDLFGDGVNVAVRLEGIAEPGGICVSDSIYEQVKNKVDVGFVDIGAQKVKNISEPVLAFHLSSGKGGAGDRMKWRVFGQRVQFKKILAVLALILILGGGVVAWRFFGASETDGLSSSLQAKISIAVLPFRNVGSDPSQDYLVDGITNDLITDLSKFHELFVIASNTSFALKGQTIAPRQASARFGVRYVLDGSVQKRDKSLRINTRLIDTASGEHLWTERYDEPIDNLFEVQDKIVRVIVRTLSVKLTRLESQRAFGKPAKDLAAYDLVLRGRELFRRSTRRDNLAARAAFEKAIEHDPQYSAPYAGLGYTYIAAMQFGWTGQPRKALEQGQSLARKAIELDSNNVEAHRLLGVVYLMQRRHDLALIEVERAIELNPNDAQSHVSKGITLLWSSRIEDAIRAIETGRRFDPLLDVKSNAHLGMAYYLASRLEDAISVLETAIAQNADFALAHFVLAASYAQQGRAQLAARAVHNLQRVDPFFSVGNFGQLFVDPAHADALLDGFKKAIPAHRPDG